MTGAMPTTMTDDEDDSDEGEGDEGS